MLDPRDGPPVEAPVDHGVDVVEEVGHPDDAVAAVLREQGRLGQELGDPTARPGGVEGREAEVDDLAAVDGDGLRWS